MTTNDLKTRIEKLQVKITTKEKTIEKKEKWIADGKHDEYDIKYLKEDIQRIQREIKEIQITISKDVTECVEAYAQKRKIVEYRAGGAFWNKVDEAIIEVAEREEEQQFAKPTGNIILKKVSYSNEPQPCIETVPVIRKVKIPYIVAVNI